MASRTIALLTDFGLADPYVGQMKAVLATLAPDSPILDLGHEIRPFAVDQAAFHLAATLPWLPPESVTCAVVDPGVGSSRGIIAVRSGGRLVLAPDNGLLTLLPRTGLEAWDLSQAMPRNQASHTFHGRDIFAPLAARLAAGEPPESLGPSLDPGSLIRLEGLQAVVSAGGIQTRALHVDRFGNVLLTARTEEFQGLVNSWGTARVVAPHGSLAARSAKTYAELGDFLGLLAGSQGYLELALGQGSAAELLGLAPGAEIRLEKD